MNTRSNPFDSEETIAAIADVEDTPVWASLPVPALLLDPEDAIVSINAAAEDS